MPFAAMHESAVGAFEALAAGGAEAKRAFDAMMGMKKIDVAAIKAARLMFTTRTSRIAVSWPGSVVAGARRFAYLSGITAHGEIAATLRRHCCTA
jgi:hypothetical protein